VIVYATAVALVALAVWQFWAWGLRRTPPWPKPRCRPWVCDACGRGYDTQDQLVDHATAQHESRSQGPPPELPLKPRTRPAPMLRALPSRPRPGERLLTEQQWRWRAS
jgi:hypothetical protein